MAFGDTPLLSTMVQTSATSHLVQVPAGTKAGGVLLLTSQNGYPAQYATTLETSGGWTLLDTVFSNGTSGLYLSAKSWVKVATSTDEANAGTNTGRYTVAITGSTSRYFTSAMYAIPGAKLPITNQATGLGGGSTASSPAPTAYTPSAGTRSYLLYQYVDNANSGTAPTFSTSALTTAGWTVGPTYMGSTTSQYRGGALLASKIGGGASGDTPTLSASKNGHWLVIPFALSPQGPTKKPYEVLNIGTGNGQNRFSMQVAPKGAGSITTKTLSDLIAGYALDPHFVVTPNDTAVQFNAPADGPTTPGSTSARSELREADASGNDIAFNPFDGGTHIMHGRSKITHHPTSGTSIDGIGITLAQLHNGSTDRVTLRTQYVSGTMRLRGRVNGSSTGFPELATGTANSTGTNIVGVEYEWKIRVSGGNGTTCTVEMFINDMVTPVITSTSLAPTVGVNTWYFKTGCYNQFNTTNVAASEYGQVELRDLSVKHSWPAVTLTDDFEDGTLPWNPGEKWANSYGTGFSESGGELLIQQASGVETFSGLGSLNQYWLADNEIRVKLSQPAIDPIGTGGYARIVYYATPDVDFTKNFAAFHVSTEFGLHASAWDGTSLVTNTIVDDYTVGSYVWLRIRESGGTLYFDSSPDGIAWTSRLNVVTPAGIRASTTGQVALETSVDKGAGGWVKFDNLNITPAGRTRPPGQFLPFFM